MTFRLQYLAAILLLAFVPVGLYAVGRTTVALIALVNVLLVTACLYYMFGPAEREDAHGRPAQ